MSGVQIKLGRLFSEGKNAVVIAADHGEFEGPIAGMVDIRGTLQKIYTGVDGVLLSPGIIRHCPQLFSRREAPLAIMRLNWGTVYCEEWGYREAHTVRAISPRDALAYGAEIALVSLTLQTGSEKTDARNVETFCSLTREAHALGMPVIGEYFPVAYPGKEWPVSGAQEGDQPAATCSPEELRDEIRKATRILAELGADAIKTFHTVEFESVAAGCPIPILGLGGSRLATLLEALRLAERLIAEGARGVVFGRNALQVQEPIKFQKALCRVVKDGVCAEAAMKDLRH